MPLGADAIASLLLNTSHSQAKRLLIAYSKASRKEFARLAALEAAWVDCDQKIPGNVEDMSDSILTELHEPFWFFHNSLRHHDPRKLFRKQFATRPLALARSFWSARTGVAHQAWLPDAATTFDAVVHFVQSGSGTGVHVGDGLVLTCAHVVDARDDDILEESSGELPKRLGRKKVLMFASGATFLAVCVAVEESTDGCVDVAVLKLGVQLVPAHARQSTGADGLDILAAAQVASSAAASGERLFCVGNPSNVDLESLGKGSIEFEPPAWHASVGQCQGYESRSTHAARDAQAARGRPPTRGELKQVLEAQPVGDTEGLTLMHSCWTYWGHSGAPLFNEHGQVCGLHSSWDSHSGMRHGVRLEHLTKALRVARQESPTESDKKRTAATGSAAGSGAKSKRKNPPQKEAKRLKTDPLSDDFGDANVRDAGATRAPTMSADVGQAGELESSSEEQRWEGAAEVSLMERIKKRLARERDE
jgi:hypothetical protein